MAQQMEQYNPFYDATSLSRKDAILRIASCDFKERKEEMAGIEVVGRVASRLQVAPLRCGKWGHRSGITSLLLLLLEGPWP